MNVVRNREIQEIYEKAHQHCITKFRAALNDENNSPEILYSLAATLFEIESNIQNMLHQPTNIEINQIFFTHSKKS